MLIGVVFAQTFFFEGSAQRELAILKEMTSGKFRHENLCTVLHVCVEKAPVQSHSGEFTYMVVYRTHSENENENPTTHCREVAHSCQLCGV